MCADQLLVSRGLAASRSQAQRLIAGGLRALTREGWRTVGKADELPEHTELALQNADESRYVSRGGLKLEAALCNCKLDPSGLRCLDVGQSTGGFTHCLLVHGALNVLGVDVGHGQLHASLRADSRVTALEGVNMRQSDSIKTIATNPINTQTNGLNATKNAPLGLFQGFDLAVGDLSFISQTLVAPQVAALLKPNAHVLMLVKPQFELQPAHISKGGLVKDPALYAQVQMRVCEAWQALGFELCNYLPSPILGGDGNTEFFIHCRKTA